MHERLCDGQAWIIKLEEQFAASFKAIVQTYCLYIRALLQLTTPDAMSTRATQPRHDLAPAAPEVDWYAQQRTLMV
jgi:hypothetical protein